MSFTRENREYFDKLMCQDWVVDGRTFNLAKMGYSWGYNDNKRSLGVHKRNSKLIELSRAIFDINPNLSIFDNTIRHEIAHAIDHAIRNTSDHSYVWKRVARQVGCDATRTTSIENRPQGKYTLLCPNGHESVAHRRPKRRKSCGKCNPHHFDERYEYKVIQNY